MKTKTLKSNLYTYGKFGKALRETIDTDSGTLYDRGRIKTDLGESDLTPDFCRIHNRDIWYMTGFIRTANIRHVAYLPSHLNHLFKDDYLYVSYDRPIREQDNNGVTTVTGAEYRVCGNDVVTLTKHIERFGIADVKPEIQKVKSLIKQKVEWFRQNHPEDYKRTFNTTEPVDVFKSNE